MSAIKEKIYGVLYNQSSSITFDETSRYQRQKALNFTAFHWSPHGGLGTMGQHFVTTRAVHLPKRTKTSLPYLPYIFGRIKIIIFFTVRTFNLEKNYNFFSVRIFMNAEKLPIIEGIYRYICGNFKVVISGKHKNLNKITKI